MTTAQAATTDDASRAPRHSRSGIIVIVAVVFLDLLGFGIIIPILPFYVRAFGLSDVFIGLLAASYSLAQFVAAPTLGRFSDEHGRRPVIMLSVGVSGIAWVVFGVAAEVGTIAGLTPAVITLFGARIIAGAAGGNIAAAQAYIADVTPPENRASGLGLVGAAFGLGFVFGPAIGGLAASDTIVRGAANILPGFIPTTQFSIPSFTAAIMSFAALGVAAVVLKEPTRQKTPPRRVRFVGQFREALADASLRPLVVGFFLTSFAFAGVQVMFVPFVSDFFGYDATQAAVFLTYIGVLGVINQGVLIGRFARRYGARRVVFAGIVSLFAALLVLALAPTFASGIPNPGLHPWITGAVVVLAVFGALASFGNGAVTVGLSTLVSQSASESTQGIAFGVTQGAGSLGRTVGPPLAAAAYMLVYWSPFIAGALVLIPVTIVLSKHQLPRT